MNCPGFDWITPLLAVIQVLRATGSFTLLQVELVIELVEEATSLLFKHSRSFIFHITNFLELLLLQVSSIKFALMLILYLFSD